MPLTHATKSLALLKQLRPGGRLVMALGPEEVQRLAAVDKDAAGRVHVQELLAVRFTRLETTL